MLGPWKRGGVGLGKWHGGERGLVGESGVYGRDGSCAEASCIRGGGSGFEWGESCLIGHRGCTRGVGVGSLVA